MDEGSPKVEVVLLGAGSMGEVGVTVTSFLVIQHSFFCVITIFSLLWDAICRAVSQLKRQENSGKIWGFCVGQTSI